MSSTFRVGIIGVNAHSGWAAEAHVPSVRAVPGLDLVALATSRQQSADEAAAAFGVNRAYGDPLELIHSPEVDIVTIAAPVPAHHGLIVAALDAGKHVVSEWPVGVDSAQTAELTSRARRAGGLAVVNLQARRSPAVLRALDLLGRAALGRILGITMSESTAGWGPVVDGSAAYLEDPASGMNLRTIQTAHTLDLAELLVGPVGSLSALTTVQYPDITVGASSRRRDRTVPDHILVQGRLATGGWLDARIAGGRPPDECRFHLEIVGTEHTLELHGGSPRGFQAGTLQLRLDGHEPAAHNARETGLADPVVNVAGVYAALRDDIQDATTTAPRFFDAAHLAYLVDAVSRAADQQRTVDLQARPS